MLANREAIASLQSDFYRDQFRKMLRWTLYSAVIMFLLIAAIIYFVLAEPRQLYFANTQEGKIFPMPAQSYQ
jgi:Na+/proline symporter